ncbi:MAG: hypothetical protein UW98_C0011G0005 [Parcubacteria group bacterium GW2011_GWC2_45_15]|nr:MAG: hypothetical protein UW98_C0011G0005 [Parcubacteria group bacterium GW2011_GWC2_45_15]
MISVNWSFQPSEPNGERAEKSLDYKPGHEGFLPAMATSETTALRRQAFVLTKSLSSV